MHLYKIKAMRPVKVHVRQLNSNIIPLSGDEHRGGMFAPPEINESVFDLTERSDALGDVIDFISLTSKDGPDAGKVFQWSDFRLPSAVGDRASDEGMILIERTL